METPIIRLHTQKYGTLDYDPSVPCIIASHFGYATDNEFRSLLNLGLAYALENKKDHASMGWLADTLLMEGNTSAEWAVSDWNPRLFAGGVSHLAFVQPKEVFAEMQIRDYVDLSSTAAKMEMASFEDVKSAKEWLHKAML
jgi:hypothetical protein